MQAPPLSSARSVFGDGPGMASSGPRVAIIGAGVIGLTSALALAARGARVCVFERGVRPGRGASWAAAGMLAPAYEALGAGPTHRDLFEACLISSRLWAGFADQLGVTGRAIGYGRHGALACARTEADAVKLEALDAACRQSGVRSRRVSVSYARKIEPALGDKLVSVLALPTDRQVDNRALIRVLLTALDRQAIQVWTGAAITRLAQGRDACWTVVGEDGQSIAGEERFDFVLVSSGAGARTLKLGETPEAPPVLPEGALSPVKGQMLALPRVAGSPHRTLRFGRGYIAPKPDRIVIGATVEPGDDTTETNQSDINHLREEAALICPGLIEGDALDTWAGVRPGTPDHAPLVGPLGLPGLFAAVGHYRNGILLAPWTAMQIASLMLDGRPVWSNIDFDVCRFNKGPIS